MKYAKPQIMSFGLTMGIIHSGQQKVPCACVESKGILYLMTLPAYEADE